MAPVRSLLLILLSAIAFGGCGGGGDPEAFAADANAICQKRIDAIDEAIDDEDRFGEMLELHEDGTESYREFAEQRVQIDEAAAEGDREAYAERVESFGDTVKESRRSRSRGNNMAKELGLDVCATPLY